MLQRRSLSRGLLVVMAAGLLSGYALGAEQSTNQNRQRATQPDRQMSQQPGQLPQAMMLARTDKLIGQEVKDTQGEKVGKIEDIVLAPNLRQVSYIALVANDKYYAVPWSALKEQSPGNYVLSITKQQLDKAQAFKEDQWPTQASPELSARGQATSMTSAPPRTTPSQPGATSSQQQMAESRQTKSPSSTTVEQRRVSKLTGLKVKDQQGADVAKIEGFVVDLATTGVGTTGRQQGGSQPAGGQTTDPNREKSGSAQSGRGQATDPQRPGAGQQMQIPIRGGQLVFTTLSFSATWGMSGKYALVPSNLVKIEPAQKTATLNATKETVQAHAFAPDNFPNLTNRQAVARIFETFGEQPYWTAYGYVPPGAGDPWGAGSAYNRLFNPAKIQTIKGTIENVSTFTPQRGAPEGLLLTVKMDNGQTATVHVGPQQYVQQKGFTLKKGDQVTVTGSETTHNGQTVVIATQLQSNGKTLQLRTNTGQPLWQSSQSQTQSQAGQSGQNPNR